MKCQKCNKLINKYEDFDINGSIVCLECYEKHYETLTDKEKIPNFIGAIK